MSEIIPRTDHRQAVPVTGRVPAKTKLGYGSGAIVDYLFMGVPWHMIWPVYTLHFKLDSVLLGVAMACPRIFGALGDSLAGGLSDNTRSSWGRRRPFILIATIIGALTMPFLWVPPSTTKWGMFFFVAISASLYTMVHSMLVVPFQALGYELTDDYDERTRVQAWKGYALGGVYFLNPWLFWICSREIFPNILVGSIWLSIMAGAVMIGAILPTVFFCHEKAEVMRQKKIALLTALKTSVRNRTFMVMQCGYVLTQLGVSCGGAAVGLYLNLYYVCGGDQKFYGLLTGVGGTVSNVMTFAGMALGVSISTHFGKRFTTLFGLGLILAGILSLGMFLSPVYPWLTIVPGIIMNLGLQSCNLMFSSMIADICDEDELKTGLRREGAYCAVASILHRTMQIGLLLLAGVMPWIAGYKQNAHAPNQDQLLLMKWWLITAQALFTSLALAVMAFYPLTREKSAQTRRALDERKNHREPEEMGGMQVSRI